MQRNPHAQMPREAYVHEPTRSYDVIHESLESDHSDKVDGMYTDATNQARHVLGGHTRSGCRHSSATTPASGACSHAQAGSWAR